MKDHLTFYVAKAGRLENENLELLVRCEKYEKALREIHNGVGCSCPDDFAQNALELASQALKQGGEGE